MQTRSVKSLQRNPTRWSGTPTHITIDSDIHRRLKAKASLGNIKIGDLASALLRAALEDEETVSHAVQTVKGEPLS